MNDDNPLLSILAGLIRWALTALFGSLLASGYITSGQITKAAPVIALGVVALALMVARQIKTRLQVRAALRLPSNATVADVKVQAKADNNLPIPNVLK